MPRNESNRLTLPVVLVAVIVVAASLTMWFWAEADAARSRQPDNAALTDATASERIATEVSAAMEELWSYDYRRLAREKREIGQISTTGFARDYADIFRNITTLAPQAKAVVTAKVAEVAVQRLHGNHAVVLVFLNQTAKKGAARPASAGARLKVGATRTNGHWKIASVTPF